MKAVLRTCLAHIRLSEKSLENTDLRMLDPHGQLVVEAAEAKAVGNETMI